MEHQIAVVRRLDINFDLETILQLASLNRGFWLGSPALCSLALRSFHPILPAMSILKGMRSHIIPSAVTARRVLLRIIPPRAACDDGSRWLAPRKKLSNRINQLMSYIARLLDNNSATCTNETLAHQGRQPVAYRLMERARCLRAVSQTAPGRLRTLPSRHYDRGARSSLVLKGSATVQAIADYRDAQPEAELGVTAWRVPRRSAERRARPASGCPR
jgi:hypothetical protein